MIRLNKDKHGIICYKSNQSSVPTQTRDLDPHLNKAWYSTTWSQACLFIRGGICSPQLNGTADRHREGLSLFTWSARKMRHDHHVMYLIDYSDSRPLYDFGPSQTDVKKCGEIFSCKSKTPVWIRTSPLTNDLELRWPKLRVSEMWEHKSHNATHVCKPTNQNATWNESWCNTRYLFRVVRDVTRRREKLLDHIRPITSGFKSFAGQSISWWSFRQLGAWLRRAQDDGERQRCYSSIGNIRRKEHFFERRAKSFIDWRDDFASVRLWFDEMVSSHHLPGVPGLLQTLSIECFSGGSVEQTIWRVRLTINETFNAPSDML